MQTVGNCKTNDGTLIPIQIDETNVFADYRQQVSVVLTQDYYPIDSAYAPRATWPTGGCPSRCNRGQSIMMTYLEASALRLAGGCVSSLGVTGRTLIAGTFVQV